MPKFLFKILLLFTISSLWAIDVPISRIHDDSALRIKLMNSWLQEPAGTVLSRRPVIERLPSGERVEIRAESSNDQIAVIFARELKIGSAPSSSLFPGWAQGSWMLTRRRDTGAGTRIRIFPRSDPYTYIDLKPLNTDRSQMDVVVYGAYLTRSLPISVPFERLYTMPLNDVLRLLGNKFPLSYFEPKPEMYRNTRSFITQVRSRINELRYENNDGAINENGNYIFIETLQPQASNPGHLNCSGFAKWLIDGCLRPVTGRRLPIEPLKKPFGNRGSSFTENWENFVRVPPDPEKNTQGQFIERQVSLANRRDPYFGLDWIRNLASEANGVLRSNSSRALEEFEVRLDKFSLLIVNENPSGRTPVYVTKNYEGFLQEAGYGFEGLHALLYALAIEDPFSFYLAAINNEIGAAVTATNPRGAPRLRQYYHIAALVPYFDEAGNFKVVVFESAAETSFAGFNRRYPGHFINLVKIPVPTRFDP